MYRPPGEGVRCLILMGSGYQRANGDKSGCVMLYSAEDVDLPWRYEGIVGEGVCTLGRVWECPALVQVLSAQPRLLTSQNIHYLWITYFVS